MKKVKYHAFQYLLIFEFCFLICLKQRDTYRFMEGNVLIIFALFIFQLFFIPALKQALSKHSGAWFIMFIKLYFIDVIYETTHYCIINLCNGVLGMSFKMFINQGAYFKCVLLAVAMVLVVLISINHFRWTNYKMRQWSIKYGLNYEQYTFTYWIYKLYKFIEHKYAIIKAKLVKNHREK